MRLFTLSLALAISACASPRPSGDSLAPFEGTFGSGGPISDEVVSFIERKGDLLMFPALWSGPLVLRRAQADSFFVAAHPQFRAAFERDASGRVLSARVYGLSDDTAFERLDNRAPRPVQLLMDGRPVDAARAYAAAGPSGVEQGISAGNERLRSTPSRVSETVAFFTELASLSPEQADVHSALGDALVAHRDRVGARVAYERALDLNPSDANATAALELLGVRPPAATDGWTLPFDLDKLFALPRPEEIEAVLDLWASRDLSPRDVEVVLRRSIDLDGVSAEARVIAHSVHGQRHLGVVIVPAGARSGSLPVLVESKGVSSNYFPLRVPGNLTSPRVMGNARSDVIYIAPGYRGERIIIGSDTLVSEGDRSNAWDGATDDAIAFMRAALSVTPEADASRICVFGRSRGGTVALLAGMRAPEIDCVVSWAAPTDWFSHMGLAGWTQAELVDYGLRNRSAPYQPGGQFIDHFLSEAISGQQSLDATRRHLIASSPLYFADQLPLAQVHWGLDDSIVPIVNGRAFVAQYEDSRGLSAVGAEGCLDVHVHPQAGHDQDRQLAPQRSQAFLLRAFGLPDTEIAQCRPR